MKKITIALALLLTTFGIHASSEADKDALAKRLSPVGQVYVAGAVAAADTAASGPRSGEKVYQTACFACHGTGALDAPKKGDAAWKTRIDQGFDVMLKHAIEGIRNMPARGTCADCSDDEIAAAIKFMTEGV
ncbi:c-type cytochrome [Rheinheimera baltica]|uniref:c-type cytochrome n=1 Tax=Rheinheimera baltica TaxID=67576 RepID=UPI00041D713B|nr:c-type cytochrome [Rheinheimera baltica]MDP5143596.1 c-type cytochrome [Rheinheimera baltica]MDP5151050.1 c-type cytochrome [Rheinheimera baltica]